MPLYEHVFLSRQDASAQQVEELTAQFKGVIEQLGGKVTKVEQWGVKSLSYRLRKNRKAHFTLLNVDAPPAALNEIERQERLNEEVLRYITVRVEELEEGPSAMMRKVDRDRERDERGGGGFRDRGDRGGGGGFAAIAETVAIVVTAAIAATVARVRRATKRPMIPRRRRRDHELGTDPDAPPVLPPPQDLSVHRRQRAEDRLQGRAAAAALRFGARQDRAEPDHGGFRQEAARAGARRSSARASSACCPT